MNSPTNYYYVTTPIYYANGHPHLGNTYTTTLADALRRFYRQRGFNTFFLTGTDEHGDKVQQAAEAAGKTPQQFTDEVSELFKRTWTDLGLEYDRFIRTTEEQHKKVVCSILQRIYDKGEIYFGEYGGNYCVGCERFLTDKELVEGKCPDHQVVPKFVKEKNYFFRMSRYQERLLEHISKIAPDFVRPERYKNEILAMLREPLEDLCISRPKSRLTWGITLPFDENYVTYVWFDALVNYLSGIHYPENPRFLDLWTNCEHLVGKDIIKPHAVFWPTMLMAADIPLYKHLDVHGYWVTPTGKMSKSLGNVVDPLDIKHEYGMDVFRYFIFREMAFGLDGTFSRESLETRYNADLANNLGNLVSRALAMVHKYRDGIVPQPGVEGERERSLRENALSCTTDVVAFVRGMEIHRALERIWALIDAANVFIDRSKPWALAKEEKSNEAAREQLNSSLYAQVEVIRFVSVLIGSFMPQTARRILSFLAYTPEEIERELTAGGMDSWGRIAAGKRLARGETLFPRRDLGGKSVETAPLAETPVEEDLVSIADFAKVKLRVGQVIEAERVPKSDKLLKLRVNLGSALGERQILAGIGKFYAPEHLVGRKVAVVANLKPARLMGLESRGMVLCGSDDSGSLELVSVGDALPPGSEIR